MSALSAFSLARQGEISTACERLVRGVLEEDATAENTKVAVQWCTDKLAEQQRFPAVVPADVSQVFGRILEKLRVHSQDEAAAYLIDLKESFLRCHLSSAYTTDAHSVALRLLLHLARRPHVVPPRMARTLRLLAERRQAHQEQQRRGLRSQAYERQRLIEMELQQVADVSSREWEEAWAQAAAEEARQVADLRSEAEGEDGAADALDESHISEVEEQFSEEEGSVSELPAHEAECCAEVPLRPGQALPPQPWKMSSVQQQSRWRVLKEDEAWQVSEEALVQIALQLLQGHQGNMLRIAADGTVVWPAIRTPQHGEAAVQGGLSLVAKLSTALHRLRQLLGILYAVQPPAQDLRAAEQLAAAISQGVLDLSTLATISAGSRSKVTAGSRLAHPPLGGSGEVQEMQCLVFGQCWWSMGQALSQQLHAFTQEVYAYEAQGLAAAGGSGSNGGSRACCSNLSIIGLEVWLQPRALPIFAACDVLDSCLTNISMKCSKAREQQWPAIAMQSLLTGMSQAIRHERMGAALHQQQSLTSMGASQQEAGEVQSWLPVLWTASLKPLLLSMKDWGTTGTMHDPCGEFAGGGDELYSKLGIAHLGTRPQIMGAMSLLPAVCTSGRYLRSLRSWEWQGPEDPFPSGLRKSNLHYGGKQTALSPRHEEEEEEVDVSSDLASLQALRLSTMMSDMLVETRVIRPLLKAARLAVQPLLVRVLHDGDSGLLRHLAALRMVAFLEREHVVVHFKRRLFGYLDASLAGEADALQLGSVCIDLNAALSEGLGGAVGRDGAEGTTLQSICVQCIQLQLSPADASKSQQQRPPPPGAVSQGRLDFNSLHLLYQAPTPLGVVLDSEALQAYSAVMALLLRVQHAQRRLLDTQRLPLIGSRGRRAWVSRGHRRGAQRRSGSAGGGLRAAASDFVALLHLCDLLCAEMRHFLVCFETYLRTTVLAEGTKALEARLRELINFDQQGAMRRIRTGGAHEEGALAAWGTTPSASDTMDVLEHAQRAHREYLHLILTSCFLVPEMRSIQADLEHVISQPAELYVVLQELLDAVVHPMEPTASIATLDASGEHSFTETSVGRTEGVDFESPAAMAALAAAYRSVAKMRRDFRASMAYLHQVLQFSLARGRYPQVAAMCLMLNFSGFYHADAPTATADLVQSDM